MSKAGRKPKANVERYENGRIKRGPSNDSGIMLVAADLAAIRQMRLNPMWRTQVGRLTASGELSTRHFDAARKILELRTDTDRILGLPPRHPRAIDLNAVGGRANDDEAHMTQDQLEKKGIKDRDRVAKFDAAEAKLGFGSARQAVIQSVVYYDMAPAGYQQLLDLKCGLDILAAFWKMS